MSLRRSSSLLGTPNLSSSQHSFREKEPNSTSFASVFFSPQKRKYLYVLCILSVAGYLYSASSSTTSLRIPAIARSSVVPFEEQDGLLYSPLSGAAEHPIGHLIRKSKREWQDKLNRQSKTLEDAVREYKRRYGRNPPKGFDTWWRFAKENNVRLVDEYDQIDKDITPFLGFPSSVLQKRLTALIEDITNYWHGGSYTLQIKSGSLLDPIGPFRDSGRAREQASLMERFVKWLPDLNITTWAHDTPILHTSGQLKAELIEAARKGTYIHPSKHDDVHDTPDHIGWETFCPPYSPLQSYMSGTHINAVPALPRSFISSAYEAIDLCNHPEYLQLHSLTGNYGIGPTPVPFWPLFSHSKMQLYSDLLITPLEQYEQDVGPDVVWEQKEEDKLLWRGSSTGSRYDRRTLWKLSQRGRLNTMANTQTGTAQIMLSSSSGLQTVNRSLSSLNSKYFDIAFAGQPIQCEQDGSCEAMQRLYRFTQGMGQEEANRYKYVIDVDGNGWSGRFHRLLSSNSAVLKSTGFVEWYQADRIQPWVHYIPVKLDYSDLHDIMAFFLGDVNGEHANDQLGKEIGLAGKQWAEEHWRFEDMEVYMFRLYLEYARALLRNEDGTGMDYLG